MYSEYLASRISFHEKRFICTRRAGYLWGNRFISITEIDRIRPYYDETQIAELTLLIGHYMMTARFLETLEVDLDESATSWDAVLKKQGFRK